MRNATRTTDPDEQNRQGVGVGEEGDPAPTLTGLFTPGVMTFAMRGREGDNVPEVSGDVVNSIRGSGGSGRDQVLAFGTKDSGHDVGVEVSPTLRVGGDNGGMMPSIIAFKPCHFTRGKNGAPGDLMPSLTAEADRGDQETVILDSPEVVFESEVAYSLSTKAGADRGERANIPVAQGIPRRLMPIECERLMGWPDNWTNIPGRKHAPSCHEIVDELGNITEPCSCKRKDAAASDSQRYKACGNGVVSNCAEWIGRRLLAHFEETAAS